MVTLQSLWSHFGCMKVLFQKTHMSPTYLNDFIKLFGGLWVDLGLLWDRFIHMKVNLGPLWGHFGVTVGSGLGQFGVSLGDFGSLDGHFAIIVDSLWIYEGPLSKNIHFPYIF